MGETHFDKTQVIGSLHIILCVERMLSFIQKNENDYTSNTCTSNCFEKWHDYDHYRMMITMVM